MDSRSYSPENLLIFGITGYARSGKDTAAKAILDLIAKIGSENRYAEYRDINTRVIRYADPIKDATAEVMKYFFEPKLVLNPEFPELRYPHEIESVKQHLDIHKDKGEKICDIDIRHTYQQLGNVFRSQNKDIFALIAARRIEQDIEIYESSKTSYYNKLLSHDKTKHIYIIPDTRFVNEEKIMREKFGSCYRLIKIDKPDITEKAKHSIPPYNHESEKQIELLTPDKTVVNDSSLNVLNENISTYVLKVMKLSGWLE